MTKLLEMAIEMVRELPEAEQDRLAQLIMRATDDQGVRLTEEQVAELRRRRKDKGRLLTLDELDEHLRRLGVL
jgi:hypothetical protein